MDSDSLRVLILQSYIRRLWVWLESFGIVMAVLGFIFLYGQAGLLEPLRDSFTPATLSWWSMVSFSISVGCVVTALIIDFRFNKMLSARIGQLLNPHWRDDADYYGSAVNSVLEKVQAKETIVWVLCTCPAFLGAVLFSMGRPLSTMFLYLGISLASGTIFIPSLSQTEKLAKGVLDAIKSLSSDGSAK